jgi:polysaccharide deacetylase family protein (PEP-CTERM system associated)
VLLTTSTNILTIDVEEWYHLNYASMVAHAHQTFESRVAANMEALLALLEEAQAKATFFFLGSVAEQYPSLVRATQQQGHEIASHGYGHELVYHQSREQFATDVRRSIEILQQASGQPVLGYRAPSWSISDATPWAYEVLADLGLRYDASLFPFRTYLYGDSRAPLRPFLRRVNGGVLQVVPASVLNVGPLRVPFGGGFYFRLVPLWLTRLAVLIARRRGQAVVIYLHPREIDPEQPRLALPPVDRFVTYVNLASTANKLRRLLCHYPTKSIARYLDEAYG